MNFKLLSKAIILCILLLTILFGWPLQNLKFDYDIESFFSQSDPDLAYYLDFRERFENDNNFVLIGISNDKGVFQQDFLEKVVELTRNLKTLSLVKTVNSPTSLKRAIIGPMGGVLQIPLIHFSDTSLYKADQKRIYGSNDVYASFFSKDTSAITILIKKEEFTTRASNDSLLLAITQTIEKLNFDEYHIAGRIKTQNYYIGKMATEMPWFAGITMLLMVAFLLVSFRCGLGVFIPITVLGVALIWTLAIIHLSGNKLDLMLTMLPALLFIIGISNSIHLITKYIDEVGSGEPDDVAMKTTLKETGVTIFITSSTTAVGFFSLMLIDIEPIQRFGLFTGIGVLITFLISITLIPALLLNIKSEHISCSYQLKVGWDRFLNSVYDFSQRNRRAIIGVSIVLLIVSLWGIKKIQFNNHFLDDITEKSELKKDLLYFEDNFNGIRPFEMGVDVKDTNRSIFDLDVLREMENIEQYLVEYYGVGALVSPLTLVKSANRALHGGRNKDYALPSTEKAMRKVMKLLKRNRKIAKNKVLINGGRNRARITGKMKDQGSFRIAQHNRELSAYISENSSLANYKLTGAAQLMDNTNSDIALSLVKGLGTALLFTALVLGILFSSIRIALLSLIPNALPLLMIAGVMGWMGIDLKVATALVFPIAFGIAVDDTIHLLTRFRMEIKAGVSRDNAIANSVLKTGKAIIITTLILSSGFLVFTMSEFSSTISIGLLVGVALAFAVLFDLLLLPIILRSVPDRLILSPK